MKDQLSPPNKTKNEPLLELNEEIIPPLELNHEAYRDYLKDYDMSIEQQNELLETLWHMMRTMVELGWGLDNFKLDLDESDQNSGIEAKFSLSINNPQTFNQVANTSNIQGEVND